MASTHGPDVGFRSQMEARRARQALLKLDGLPEIEANPATVARLVAASARLGLGVDSVSLDLGDGVKVYTVSDVEVLLGLCSEAFERFDAAGPPG